ncbi:tryptophan hydroxylase [Pseudoalteromonas luteoviolacea]|uniref:tryptophan hydroxylase n=1 Tax=Pseudoalteromonas luteoviolacea TaxID=43657 RepID=UPI001F3B94B7|nr:tryptophan hydroxylase [Pseudoalteromonas luteoviolacea]MCF6439770.1 tryptophan hydroxylase [Pseudoalteromonas luteoviolacea]
MKILVVGAGPSGLMFASETKKLQPDWDIRIIEKNHPDANVVGWGVVLPGRAPHHPANPLSYLANHETLDAQYLEDFKLTHHNQSALKSTGVTLCGAERKSMVRELRQLCVSLGITIDYEQPALEDAELLCNDYDLVVVSNGINHTTTYYRDALKPKIEFGKNRYMWYGTPKTFDAMNLIFKSHSKGIFVAHSYKYSSTMSTFVVECSEETYQKSGLDEMSAQDAEKFIASVFEDDLDGNPVMAQEGLKWRNFMTLSHEQAFDGNVALLGDALQSGHFSIGHGTTMAVVGAQILVKAVYDNPDSVQAALTDFNQHVMPIMRLFDQHATISRLWFETVEDRMHLSPPEIAQSFAERRSELPPLPAALGQALERALARGEK